MSCIDGLGKEARLQDMPTSDNQGQFRHCRYSRSASHGYPKHG